MESLDLDECTESMILGEGANELVHVEAWQMDDEFQVSELLCKQLSEMTREGKFLFREGLPRLHGSLLIECRNNATAVLEELRQWEQSREHRASRDNDVTCGVLSGIEAKARKVYNFLCMGFTSLVDCSFELYPSFGNCYEESLLDLVKSCLVIECQPPEVLKKDLNHNCRLRHLLAEELIIKVDTEARVLLMNEDSIRGGSSTGRSLGVFENETCASCLSNEKNPLVFEWKKLKLHDFSRSGNVSATDEIFFLLFEAPIPLILPNGAECVVTCKAFSSPFVAIVATKQICSAQGRTFWNKISQTNCFPFTQSMKFKVQLGMLLDHLDAKWRCACSSPEEEGRGLDDNARKFLTDKLFDQNVSLDVEVTWEMFHKFKLNGKKFSFWEYFCRILDLTSCNAVRSFWNKGHVHGFLERTDAEMLLTIQRPKTFLFRYSQHLMGKRDSRKAGLSLCFNYLDKDNCKKITHLQPYTEADLRKGSLLEAIKYVSNDLNLELHFLYPDIPVREVFDIARRNPLGEIFGLNGYVLRRTV